MCPDCGGSADELRFVLLGKQVENDVLETS